LNVFDAHIHVQPWQMMKPEPRLMMQKTASPSILEILSSAGSLLRHLDAERIERVCCINYVSPDVMGFTRETNDWIADFTRDHRDRLLPVGSVNALHEAHVRDEANRILDLGIRLVKVHPPHQLYSPNAYRTELPQLAELYLVCQERGVPVMFHTGTSIFPKARNVFADPMPIDDVAIDFPDLKLILAHAGRPLYGDTAFFLARRHPNVMLDLSGIPPKSLLRFIPRLRELADKALWGTDWPSPGVASMRGNVEAFLELGLGEEAEQKILWSNAQSLFGASS
jgi:predicted TIM-barrel fold metal-dependent hydrolase